jgi:hypothetical protein
VENEWSLESSVAETVWSPRDRRRFGPAKVSFSFAVHPNLDPESRSHIAVRKESTDPL